MIIKKDTMRTELRDQMRGGKGTISILHYAEKEKLCNARLLGLVTVPPNGSIGEHPHINEVEYFIILKGSGIAIDNGQKKEMHEGDVLITGKGETHSIENLTNEPLIIMAIIMTE